MATASSGALVAVDDDQLRAGTLPAGTCEVVTFVPAQVAHGYITDGVYQIRAKARGAGKDKRANVAAEHALAVVLAGMAERGVYGLVRYSLRGPARYGLLTPAGDLLPCYTDDQVRAPRELPGCTVSADEVAMAANLIDAIGVSVPVLVDDTAVAVQAVVDRLAAGIEAPPELVAPPIVDLMASLNASIDAAKALRSKVEVPA